MNHKKDSECFDAITKQFNGNKYAALSYVQRKARNYLNETDNIILDSEAVTWALRGERPEIADRQTYSQVKRRYADSYIEEVLCYVDDLEVKRSVRKSIKASRHNRTSYTSTMENYLPQDRHESEFSLISYGTNCMYRGCVFMSNDTVK